MPILTFFSSPVKINYRAHRFSKAALFFYISTFLNIIIPWIVIYRSDGLWKKIEFFQEQPTITFNHNLIIVIDLVNSSSVNERIIWTTFSKINNHLNQEMIRSPFINVSLFSFFVLFFLFLITFNFFARSLNLIITQMEKMII